MAKITAYGATEVARLKARSQASGTEYLYVLNSRGVILSRFTGDLSDGYSVQYTIKRKENIDRDHLERYVKARGLTIL